MNHVSTCAGLKNIHNSEISNTLQWNSDCTAVGLKLCYLPSENNKRIAKNMMFLYVRMI